MAGLWSVWVLLRGLWDPRPPVGGNRPAPGPAFAPGWDPDPRWASRSGRRYPVKGLGRGDPGRAVAGAGIALARVRAASQGRGEQGDYTQRGRSRLGPKGSKL